MSEIRYYVRPGDHLSFEYTMSISVFTMGRALDTEAAHLEAQRRDMLERMARRINEFFDSVVLMER